MVAKQDKCLSNVPNHDAATAFCGWPSVSEHTSNNSGQCTTASNVQRILLRSLSASLKQKIECIRHSMKNPGCFTSSTCRTLCFRWTCLLGMLRIMLVQQTFVVGHRVTCKKHQKIPPSQGFAYRGYPGQFKSRIRQPVSNKRN